MLKKTELAVNRVIQDRYDGAVRRLPKLERDLNESERLSNALEGIELKSSYKGDTLDNLMKCVYRLYRSSSGEDLPSNKGMEVGYDEPVVRTVVDSMMDRGHFSLVYNLLDDLSEESVGFMIPILRKEASRIFIARGVGYEGCGGNRYKMPLDVTDRGLTAEDFHLLRDDLFVEAAGNDNPDDVSRALVIFDKFRVPAYLAKVMLPRIEDKVSKVGRGEGGLNLVAFGLGSDITIEYLSGVFRKIQITAK